MKSVILYTLFVVCLMALPQIQSFSWEEWGNGRKWGRSLNTANANHRMENKMNYRRFNQARGITSSTDYTIK
jgi:hypothetical protein